MMQMRARERGDLEDLIAWTEVKAEIIETPDGDYRFRIIIAPLKCFGLMRQLSTDILYDNFKSEIAASPTQKHKSSAYAAVWAIMKKLQR
ncbi:MAG: hypothetical protein JWL59_3106 [Chthoniobacteraceae bacterium]|nr:hypothetical protein [Chthoniobacteraceae bacterium]